MVKKLPTAFETYGRQCGEGWNSLIGPLCDEVLQMRGAITQIKEKIGPLNFHYKLPATIKAARRRKFQRKVMRATDASLKVCETCGSPGELTNLRGVLLVACDACLETKKKIAEASP
jgi:hypothetical protein